MIKHSNIEVREFPKEGDYSSNKREIILFVGLNGKEICESLMSYNYTGLSLPSFTKALFWLKNQILTKAEIPIAIISDFALPDGSVFSFHYEIKLNKKLASIPFVVLAKNRSKEDKIKALKVGIDDFYVNDLNAKHIHERIQFLCRFKKLTANLEPSRILSLSNILPKFKLKIFKRVFDILISFLSLVVLSPLFLLIAILIKMESKGPVFYISLRAGTGYKIFHFYKFRTMRVNAENELDQVLHLNQYSKIQGNTSFVKIRRDPRVTRFGRILRHSSLDELPQLINVLLGDMSIVGNRPLPLYEAERLTKDQFARRFLAPAGITGLWQISKKGSTKISEGDRINLDIAYAEKSSFLFDLKIIFRTIPVLFQKEPV